MNLQCSKAMRFLLLCWAVWMVVGIDSTCYGTDLGQTIQTGPRLLGVLQMPSPNSSRVESSTAGRRAGQLDFVAPTNLVFIAPGTFRMGSPTNEVDRQDNEGPQISVTISQGFWIGKYPVTQAEYLAVTGQDPSYFTPRKGYAPDLSRPVEQVSWFDATNYCYHLTQQERAAGRIGTNRVFRLPKEAEWEYACRAGTSTRFSYGEDPGYSQLTNYGWYKANSDGTTHPVGQKLPNPWGLYEMHGHVFEWCQDLYVQHLGGATHGSKRPSQTRVFRGGLWDGSAGYCRSAYRGHSVPGGRSCYIGFRVVMAPDQ